VRSTSDFVRSLLRTEHDNTAPGAPVNLPQDASIHSSTSYGEWPTARLVKQSQLPTTMHARPPSYLATVIEPALHKTHPARARPHPLLPSHSHHPVANRTPFLPSSLPTRPLRIGLTANALVASLDADSLPHAPVPLCCPYPPPRCLSCPS
jgi:hypothetical protein